jgi:hypothetical protein
MLPGTFYSRNKAKILLYEKQRHASLLDHQRENLKAYQAVYYAYRKKKQQVGRMEESTQTPPPVIKTEKPKKEKPKKEPKITASTTKRVYKKKEKHTPIHYQYEKGIFTLTFD